MHIIRVYRSPKFGGGLIATFTGPTAELDLKNMFGDFCDTDPSIMILR